MPKNSQTARKKRQAAKKEESEEEEEDEEVKEEEEPKEEPKPKAEPKPEPKAKGKAKKEASSSSSSSSDSESESESESEEEDKKSKKKKGKGAEQQAAPKTDGKKEEAAAAAAPGPLKMEFRPHTSYPDITGPETVMYCPVCGLPPDFCQYGPSWDKCKPVAMEKFPQFYPELCGVSLEDAKDKAKEANEKSKQKLLPGGKLKREASPSVTVKKFTRGGRKCVTSVAGLDGFGVKLEAAAKLFKKKFACGSSVVKGENGAPDTVDIQGDFGEEVIEHICDEFKDVPREKCTIADGGTKKKGKSTK